MTKPFVNIDNTKHRPTGTYGNTISQIIKDGVCPFCPEHLAKYHPNPIIKTSQYWQLTKNAYPYEGTKHHFLIIHKDHAEHLSELTAEDWADLQLLMNATTAEHSITGGALIFRFGETKYNGASVAHLHAHVVMGPGQSDAKPVLMRVG